MSTIDFYKTSMAFSVNLTSEIASGALIVMLGLVGKCPVHFNNLIVETDGGQVKLELIESPTVTDRGTLFIPKNRNRLMISDSEMSIYSGSTIADGTILSSRTVYPTGSGQTTISQAVIDTWLLSPDKYYAFTITNDSVATINVSAEFIYSEPDRV